MKSKKGMMDQFGGLAIAIASFTLVIVIAFLVMANIKTQMTDQNYACQGVAGHAGTDYVLNATGCCLIGGDDCTTHQNFSGLSDAWNSTSTLQNATATMPAWVPLIVYNQVQS